MKTLSKGAAQKQLVKLKIQEQLLLDAINAKDDITSKIKTFADACKATKENPKDKKFTVGAKDTIAYEKIKVITRALNEGWKADYSDKNQIKYFPCFEYKGASGFVFHSYYCSECTVAGCGVRQVFKTAELAKYAAVQFVSIYNEYLN